VVNIHLEVGPSLVISAAESLIVAEMVLALLPVKQMVILHAHLSVVAMSVPLLVPDFQVLKPLPVARVWPSWVVSTNILANVCYA
jgi:hypothetical protein